MIGLSIKAQEALDRAVKLAMRTGGYVYTEHLLYGMLTVDCVAGRLLNAHGVYREDVFDAFSPAQPTSDVRLSDRTRSALERAAYEAERFGCQVVGTEHILYSALEDETSVAAGILYRLGVDPQFIRRLIAGLIVDREGKQPEMSVAGGGEDVGVLGAQGEPLTLSDLMQGIKYPISQEGARAQNAPRQESDRPIEAPSVRREGADRGSLDMGLERFGVDLTKKAREGKLDPVIGRDKETERVIEILSRRSKNNPILIGEPGVGKSAVVDGLAQAIVAGKVPDSLKGKTVFSLDLTSLVAGTRYRGDFEERLKSTLSMIKERGDIILFIDEIHTILKAGSSEGGLDIANIIKPMLARGELTTIGATTLEEYRKQFEQDSALERRFQPVLVEEPSVSDTVQILTGLRPRYEAHHGVTITDEAIWAAANLSDRYVADRFLPDKAVDLIDEAAAKKRLYGGDTVDENDIADVVGQWTGIPVSKMTDSEGEKLARLDDILQARVIGQAEACHAVARAVRRARAGLKDPRRPIGSFIFLGPTGVGKTELAKALAEAMFGDEDMIVRVDMSEYQEKESISRLIGAAPGLVGFEEGGQLTEQVRRKPYSIVLFDEIEKGHPDIYNLLLQILEEGTLTDSHARKVSFKNTIVILTSNIGAKEAREKRASLGFYEGQPSENDDKKERHIEALKAYMKPEIINRIDEIVVFDSLSRESVGKIADLMLTSLRKRLEERRITLFVAPEAKAYIVDRGYDAEYGARPMRRAIQRLVEDRLSEKIISGELPDGASVTVQMYGGELSFAISGQR